jgi:hypothetical protein
MTIQHFPPINSAGVITEFVQIVPFDRSSISDELIEEYVKKLITEREKYAYLILETFYDDPELQKNLEKRLEKAVGSLNFKKGDDKVSALQNVQRDIYKVHLDVHRERQKQADEKKLIWGIPVLVIVNLVITVGIAIFIFITKNATQVSTMPLLDIPFSIILWAAIGNLIAVLMRYIRKRKRRQIQRELLWLLLRPLVSILMGVVAYLAVVASLIILVVPSAGISVNSENLRPQMLSLIAFGGGVSDPEEILIGIRDKLPWIKRETSNDQVVV